MLPPLPDVAMAQKYAKLNPQIRSQGLRTQDLFSATGSSANMFFDGGVLQ